MSLNVHCGYSRTLYLRTMNDSTGVFPPPPAIISGTNPMAGRRGGIEWPYLVMLYDKHVLGKS